jgi:hypothetical protein
MWIVRYQCGCTDEAPRKRGLLEYCGRHGSDAVEWNNVGRSAKRTASGISHEKSLTRMSSHLVNNTHRIT